MTIYYTGKGDEGTTNRMGRGRIKKNSAISAAMGDVDELNSAVGVAIANIPDEHLDSMLKVIQDRLFAFGAEISASGEGGTKPKRAITAADVKDLERQIDEMGAKLPELKKFVLPGGSVGGAYLHLARSIARRAERSVVALNDETRLNPNLLGYMNRLSSFFFASALYLNRKEGIEETNPTYG